MNREDEDALQDLSDEELRRIEEHSIDHCAWGECSTIDRELCDDCYEAIFDGRKEEELREQLKRELGL